MKKYKIGYTTGVYDMFHIGHLNLLTNAKALCDFLIVGVSTDELVRQYKQKKTIIPFEERAAIVGALRCVDRVVPQKDMDKVSMHKALKFDAVFVGDDWKNSDRWNQFETEFGKLGVDVVYLPHTDGISSTLLRKKLEGK